MKFTLLTPAQQLAETEATYVTVAGEAGDFGVLPGHMPLVSTLRPGGTVSVTDKDGKTETFTVSAGVAEVSPTSVVILAETATRA
ncbi:MAG: ATP synthase F1 subunit epsilon [Blastochloris viridis]|uniref:ATP synthase F1 subunit epsilon n=1 Tax=Blastochloris viridis TaxID=1079 RepID=A0A6N4RFJ9_BLAVI|nr:MAG: ATP synthase F1 subunit epsilon [Blastochloris viridis]